MKSLSKNLLRILSILIFTSTFSAYGSAAIAWNFPTDAAMKGPLSASAGAGSASEAFIPEIVWGSAHAKEDFIASIKRSGFAQFTFDPKIFSNLPQKTTEEWRGFYARSEEEKLKAKAEPGALEGFFPFASETGEGYAEPNRMEYFHTRPSAPLPEGMSDNTHAVFNKISEISMQLAEWLEEAISESARATMPRTIKDMIKGPLMRVLHYPELVPAPTGTVVVNTAHRDIDVLTVVLPSGPGLEVLRHDGSWYPVGTKPNTMVINIGDMLAKATGNFLPSTTHRVTLSPEHNKDRMSLAFFNNADFGLVFKDGVVAGDYFKERLAANLENKKPAADVSVEAATDKPSLASLPGARAGVGSARSFGAGSEPTDLGRTSSVVSDRSDKSDPRSAAFDEAVGLSSGGLYLRGASSGGSSAMASPLPSPGEGSPAVAPAEGSPLLAARHA